MDEATRAYLFRLGNPYAKLSILDDVESVAQPSPGRSPNAGVDVDPTQAYLFELENPYAKLSVIPQEESLAEAAEPEERIDLVWKTRTSVYEYVSEAFALPVLRTRPPALLKEFGEKVVRLSPRAQNLLLNRIAAHLPDERVVYNRLSPKELDRLFVRLLEMADGAAALDGEAG